MISEEERGCEQQAQADLHRFQASAVQVLHFNFVYIMSSNTVETCCDQLLISMNQLFSINCITVKVYL